MLHEWIAQFPWWFSAGMLGGAGISVLIAGVFLIGGWLSPTPEPDPRQRIDGTNRRRTEISTYLRTIDEPYLEDHTIHDELIAFYLPRRDVAITFDAQAYFSILDAGTHAILCEHEMPGINLGRRLPFETPEAEMDSSAPVDADVDEAFRLLGLSPGADSDTVTSAYRSKIKNVHPDHGGDSARFQEIHDAYTVAKKAAK